MLDSSSSCIKLIFASQPNLVMRSTTQNSLHPNCHHQLVFAKFNLSIYYPPPYEGTVWYYSRENGDLIWRAIDHFHCDKVRQHFNERWFRKLWQLHKNFKNKSPWYLSSIIPTILRVHGTRHCDNIPLLKMEHLERISKI